MNDRNVIGLVAILLIFGFLAFLLMNPHEEGTTAAKVRDTVKTEVRETTERLNNAFDAAKKDADRVNEKREQK